ncbi:UNVERIFIED_CONTAM: hypothetical protein GTU68_065492 [Idotea baltica]|nr:hypothetical protein [Idotea baltica]
MCGRSSLTKTEKELEARFNATFYSDELERYNPLPSFNVAPTHFHPVITNVEQNHIRLFRWGLIPNWAKDTKIGYKMINARKETITEKNAFKYALKQKRCLVPMDGFYEWKKLGKNKQPYYIRTIDQEIFCCAGLWEVWQSPRDEVVESFTIITQEPNSMLKDIHDRMPAILLHEQEELWLDDSIPPEELLNMITPYPQELMEAYPVANRVGKVSENDVDLLKRVPPIENIQQGDLFG